MTNELATIQTPDEAVLSAAMAGIANIHTRRAYTRALRQFFAWREAQGGLRINRITVQAYRTSLVQAGAGPATITTVLAAIRKLTSEALMCGGISEVDAAGIRQVPGIESMGHKAGQWLSMDQVKRMMAAIPRETLRGSRDYAALAMLIGCGLRRGEAVSARVDQLVLREGRFCLLDMTRKRGRVQTIPVQMWVAQAITTWVGKSGISDGPILRGINKYGVILQALSTAQLYRIVASSAARIGVKLAAHDCRRTFAGLVESAGADMRSIQSALGHSSITTTEKYLEPIRSMRHAACDLIEV